MGIEAIAGLVVVILGAIAGAFGIGHAIIEALNKLGKSRAFMPYLGNEHRLIDSCCYAKLFHRGCN
ncbi:hypothetical protein ACSLO7_31030, partial [Klebsiella pneumoniae]